MKLDPKIVRDQITNLMLLNPELESDEVLRADMIEGETEAFDFLSRLVHKINETQATADGLGRYVEALKMRADRFDRRIDGLRKLARLVMESADLRKAELSEATLSIRNGPRKVLIINEHEIPDDFWRVKKEPDKTKIKVALQAGNAVGGAALSNGEATLAILIR